MRTSFITFFWTLCFFVAINRGIRSEQGLHPQRRGSLPRDRTQLLRALEAPDSPAIARAFEELALKRDVDLAVWKIMRAKWVRWFEKSPNKDLYFDFPPLWLDGFAQPGKAVVPTIVEMLNSKSTSAKEMGLLLLVLGRMGPIAKEAIPLLRQKLTASQLPPATKVQIRVVLANLGETSKENLTAILTALRERENRKAAARTIASIRPGDWVSEEMIKEFTNEPTPHEALALGTLGGKAASAANTLDRCQRTAIKNKSAAQIIYGLALARIDPKQQETALNRVCTHYFQTSDLGHLALLEWPPYVLVDAKISKQLGQFVAGQNPDFARAALDLLGMTDLSAREAAPHVLTFVRGDANPDRRVKAAQVLARIADYSLLPELKVALEKEKSKEVREELEVTIKFIETLKPDKRRPD